MPYYKEIIRLYELGLSQRKIASHLNISRDTAREVIAIATRDRIEYSNIVSMPDVCVSELFNGKQAPVSSPDPLYEMPDFNELVKQLKKPGVTMTLLWEEYSYNCRQARKIPYKRSQFFYYFRKHLDETGFTDIIKHKPGEEIEVDWAGTQPYWTDPDTGEIVSGYLFVGVLSFSGYAYAEVCPDMKEESWINCHIHMFDYFQGVSKIIVPDNLKTGVLHHKKYEEAELNRSYAEMAEYYGIAVIPARVRHPKDKPLAENTVNQFTKYIIGKLRDYQFFSIDEYNRQALKELDKFNKKPFQKKPGSRYEMFMEIELESLHPLPKYAYEFAVWKTAKVAANSHFSFEKRYYSVPAEYRGYEVELRLTRKNITVYYKRNSICVHNRSDAHIGAYITVPEHMPKNSNAREEYNKERYIKWANDIGPYTVQVVTDLFAQVKYEQQGYNGSKSILMLASKYSSERLENACGIALAHIAHPRYKNIKAILVNNQDTASHTERSGSSYTETTFLRGSSYYKGGNRQ